MDSFLSQEIGCPLNRGNSTFGIALAVGAAGGGRLTETGLSLGTPYYMSPEQATGDQFVGSATDTYALGAVLYEMLTGDPPYIGSTAQAVLGQIIAGEAVSATKKRGSVPANVDAAHWRSYRRIGSRPRRTSQRRWGMSTSGTGSWQRQGWALAKPSVCGIG